MSLPILTPFGPKPRPEQAMPGSGSVGGLSILRGRVHEFCGPSRVALAVMLMAECAGTVIWVCPGWQAERLFPDGLAGFVDPARLIFARARRPEDILWTLEEVLRSGAAPLVVAEVTSPPALTPVRRMNLAAEAGMEAARLAGRPAPLGLMLVPGDGGAAGAESRWHMAPLPSGSGLTEGGRLWRLERRRARNAAPAAWRMERDAGGVRLAAG